MSGWVQEKSGEATKMASKTGQSIQDRAVEAKDQTGSFLGEKSEVVTKAASETTEAAKKMSGEAMAKAPVAPKENVFQQAGGNMVGAATDAKDVVMNTLGMGGGK
ncbi:hypothetical protein CFC21_059273 [Triticum aestivum]|uniref:Cold responsive protein n=3 Tax=Triticum TaxID=4564 RepID=A0A9R0TB23_TRITD|nr:ABA-inducible protein PHV A1-like [Triticum dicoccoides]XP_044367062.1 ABA-inducible protein PHV A1-like [Triticum aestivum]KAF7050987.1 hypothetical protein CFC21_059273 [Triticum aestivum]VAI10427.1 unnamed protein product [Triticum turgidum subsp. durum]